MKINKNQLIEIVCKALGNDEVTFDSSIYDIDEWDSLSQLSILTELDDALDGKVADIDGIANTQSVSEIYDLLKKNSLIK